MIYVTCAIIVTVCGYIGKRIAGIYVIRDNFFGEIINFCGYLKNNIEFKQGRIEEVFESYLTERACKFDYHINQILHAIREGERKQILNDRCFYFLKNEERLSIKNFFIELGCANSGIECSRIDCFLKELNLWKMESSLSRKSKEPICYKLSLSIGVIICILII